MAYVRTNVVIDDRLMRKVMRTYGFRTKREAIDYALRRLAGSRDPRDMLDMVGIGWEGDLEEMRRDEFPKLDDAPGLRDVPDS
jgi:Arc/MetJ family transcription regulator